MVVGNSINPNIVRAHLPAISDARTIRYCVRYAWVYSEAWGRVANGEDGSVRVREMSAEYLRRQCARYVSAA